MSDPVCVVRTDAIVGESPTWCDRTKLLYWVDIQGKKIHRFNPKNNKNETFQLPEIVTALALCEEGDQVLLSLRKSLAYYQFATNKLENIANLEMDKADNRCNDAKCDPQGRFWVGTMNDLHWDKPEGALYQFNSRNNIIARQLNVTCANGMGWSPDQRIMYFTDSFRYTIFAYDYDSVTGEITNRRPFVTLNPADGVFPDGLTVDSLGFVWSAQVGRGQVVRYDSQGISERVIRLPVPRTTSCAFGGNDLKTLYITSATQTMNKQQLAAAPLSGSLFAVEMEIAGLPTNRFVRHISE